MTIFVGQPEAPTEVATLGQGPISFFIKEHTVQLSKIISAILLTVSVAACGAANVDKVNKTINPMADKSRIPRDAGVERLAKAVCGTYADHHAFGRNEKYSTNDECMTDYKKTFAEKYTAAACAEPHAFDTDKFEQCEARAKNWEASSNVFDLAGFFTSCAAMNICK